MSSEPRSLGLILEWSPQGVVAYDHGSTSAYGPGAVLPFGGREALIAVSRRSIFIRSLRVPNATPEDIRAVLMVRLAELFPFANIELAWDFQLTEDVNAEGRLAIVAAMPSTELQALTAQMKASGVRVRQVVPVALGSALLAHSLQRDDATVVERSASGTSVDIVMGGHLRYSRAGGLAPLEVEVSRTHAAAALPCLPVVAAAGTAYPDADENTTVSTLEAFAGADAERLRIAIELPEAVAARETAKRKQRQRFTLLLSVASLAMAAYVYMGYADAADAVSRLASMNKAKLGRLQKTLSVEASKAAAAEELQKTLKLAFEPAQRMSDILTLSVNRAPEGVWLSGLTLERGRPILLRGMAKSNDSVSEYVHRLAAEKRFRDVTLVFANNALIDEVPVVQFSISAFPVGNVPIMQQNRANASGEKL